MRHVHTVTHPVPTSCVHICPSVYYMLLLQSFLTKDVKHKLCEELKIITRTDKLILLCLRIFWAFAPVVVTSFSSVLHLHIQAQVFVPVTGMFSEHFKITPFGSRRLVLDGTANVRGSAVQQFMSGHSQSPLKSSGHFSAHPLSRRAKELVHCADPRKLCS